MKLIIFLGFLSVTAGSPDGVGIHHEEYHPTPYHYEYKVHDDKEHLDFGAEEKGDGSGTVHGSYHVKLPDGRLQHVSYTVDDYSGYVAKVSYDGRAYHPATYGHGYRHRSGKSLGNNPSLDLSDNSFPVEDNNLRSGKSKVFPSSPGLFLKSEIDQPAIEDFISGPSESVLGSVFDDPEADLFKNNPEPKGNTLDFPDLKLFSSTGKEIPEGPKE